ncbi:DUF1343 domain-containing protein [Bizionia paragorgiae]|uniref:exo-beta-N-acetylmuramidase NamZ family protein n=1 Tax=Bizionia paragorgiae TaxID=283786 RepID=UPI00299D8E19|nr:DUF1343 domain-containing protein [Bizionia paragorgiae]MDX1271889.1 DUF1343 domain-containing protein [Bizionia paragorgiae]
MKLTLFKNTVLFFLFLGFSCGSESTASTTTKNKPITNTKPTPPTHKPSQLSVGANQTESYLPLLNGKRVAIVANQTSVIFKNKTQTAYTHIVDSLLQRHVDVKKVFAPEHGFRGTADAGELVKDGIDTKTGLPIVSLYGKNKKPSAEQLEGIDMVIFDIQDVGARFYTYISSLHYVMEACAEHNIPVLILDRPNPNGHYIDGPILEPQHQSFVGMHPIPVVHGLTIGEYAKMINGEQWLNNNLQCELTVIPVKHYKRDMTYSLPIKPSPNLPNDSSINLYPSLCFFEGTNVSAGRGTDLQFQIYGSPYLSNTNFEFTPKPNEGAKYPKYKNQLCYGFNLSSEKPLEELNLSYLINAYNNTKDKSAFFISNGFFTKLAGTKKLQEQIESGLTEAQIKATWKSGLEAFEKLRQQYFIYN